MNVIPVKTGSKAYDIIVHPGMLNRFPDSLRDVLRGRQAVIITDANVSAIQNSLLDTLSNEGQIPIITLPAGEPTKSWNCLADLLDQLLDLGIERGDTLIAVGGGVIGDLVGFAASILKRGCRFVQVPTTLLAQVDSSVGGKTAINVAAGKNLIGSFYQPELVLIDPKVLSTLGPREMRAGFAEVIKYGLIDDPAFFSWCCDNGAALLSGNIDALTYAISHSVAAKARIVSADERETQDVRALLNLGHTFGHALEAETGFSERLLHGEAVAAGMALAFQFSALHGIAPKEDAEQVAALLKSLDMPHGLASAGVDASGETLVDHMRHDKKMDGGTLPFILARGIGHSYVDKVVKLEEVVTFLNAERGLN